MRGTLSLCLQMTLALLIPYINSLSMAQKLAVHILGNGLGRQQLHDAYSNTLHGGRFFIASRLTFYRQLTKQDESSSILVYITGDGSDVYKDDFMAIANPDGSKFHPTLILVGTRLGIDKVTPAYWDALKATLQMPQSVGIAG